LINLTDKIQKEILDFLEEKAYTNKSIDYLLDMVRLQYRYQLDMSRDEFIELLGKEVRLFKPKTQERKVILFSDLDVFKISRDEYEQSLIEEKNAA
jgi:signal transduction histidine kinase